MLQCDNFTIPAGIPGIYAIRNLENGKIYVGKSQNTRDRIINHFADLKRNEHANKALQADYNNGNNFAAELLQSFEDDPAFIAPTFTEKLYIYQFFKLGFELYNAFELKGETRQDQEINLQRIIASDITMKSSVALYVRQYQKRNCLKTYKNYN